MKIYKPKTYWAYWWTIPEETRLIFVTTFMIWIFAGMGCVPMMIDAWNAGENPALNDQGWTYEGEYYDEPCPWDVRIMMILFFFFGWHGETFMLMGWLFIAMNLKNKANRFLLK